MRPSQRLTINGVTIAIRPLRPPDRPELLRGFEHLSFESRRRRFLGGVKSLPPRQLEALWTADGLAHIALVAVELDARRRERSGIGIAHSIRNGADPAVAEFAIAIADEWQGRGVGTLLAGALAEEATRNGVRRWKATVFADNLPLRRLLARVTGEIQQRSLGDGVIELDCQLPLPVASAAETAATRGPHSIRSVAPLG